ncbi:hypothetical protein [Bradyrhizobium glycinis]|uniref:hypothetical protein n=1 Tax=Bradyrhizobium glycinis TaxID=2751812 RepID=UPI0018D5BDAA|nr:hypothetical protein [Bradyrhizobium glycinis]MBH5372228.1 hypothetical protein [Bradyrhizobium glycinis]
MHKKQIDLMPLRRAIEAPRIDSLTSDVKASTAARDVVEKFMPGDRFWVVQSPRRHLSTYLGRGIGRMTISNRGVASSETKAHRAVQECGAELRAGMARHFSIGQRVAE